MKKMMSLLVAVIMMAAYPASLPAQEALFREDQILVKPKVPPNELNLFHAARGNQVIRIWPRFGNLQVVRLPAGTTVEDAIAALEAAGLVDYAEPDYYGGVASHKEPNDPDFSSLWGLHNTSQDADIDAPEGWHFRTDAADVIVAVLDTGVRYTHEDLEMNMWSNPGETADGQDSDNNGYVDDIHGINAITGSGDPMDDHNHGTHVAVPGRR